MAKAVVSMKLEGFAPLQKALARAPEVARVHASSAVAASTFAIANKARTLAPRDTGKLKESIDAVRTVSSLNGRVGLTNTDVYYWRFVEFGTKNMAARPFFRPAAEEERDVFVQRMRAIGPQMERDLSVSRFG